MFLKFQKRGQEMGNSINFDVNQKIDGKLIIGGEEQESVSGKRVSVFNPANGNTVGTVPLANDVDVEKAVESANEAFPVWKDIPPTQRAEKMICAASNIKKKRERIAKILTLEQGKPLREALGEVDTFVAVLKQYAEEAKRIEGYVVPSMNKNLRSFVVKEPIGVCGLIVPWNYPLALLALKMAPALAAGCTVVVKPSIITPLATYELIKAILDKDGFPKGTINLITGRGNEVGESLVKNTLVRKVSFTGSTEVGKTIMDIAATSLKPLSMELGGNSPFIVWSDADLDLAVSSAVKRSFRNMGQICNSINRIYVHKGIYQEFLNKFIESTKKLKIGNGLEKDVDLGPMATQTGIERVKTHLKDAEEKGAKIIYGGKRPDGEIYQKGNFFEPTIITNVSHEMLIMNEETFGPVAPIMPVAEVEEAIELANSSRYGLVSYAFTSNLKLAFMFAERLEAGTVVINHVSPTNMFAPYGGIKDSGFGRELGHFGIEEYLYIKHINLNIGGK